MSEIEKEIAKLVREELHRKVDALTEKQLVEHGRIHLDVVLRNRKKPQ